MSPPPPTHLIIVCCHAVWLGGPSLGVDESEWLIEEFQRGETATYVAHVRAGVDVFVEVERGGGGAVVVFSGAATKPATRLSEAQSYLNLLAANPTLSPGPASLRTHLLSRSYAEPNALDSYQNLLFSLLLFHNVTGHAPRHITLVSHAFKQHRFTTIHAPALRWPLARFSYVGIDPPECVVPRAVLDRAEEEEGVGLWRRDWYGQGERLVEKRRRRNVWAEEGGDGWYDGVLRPLVRWEGPGTFPCRLPWAEPVTEHDAPGCGDCTRLLLVE